MTQPSVAPAILIRQFLVDSGAVFGNNAVTWRTYIGGIPDDSTIPDQVVGVLQTQGRKKGRDHKTGEVVETYGIHIRVRGNSDHEETYAKAKQITNKLDAVDHVSVTVDGSTEIITSIQRGNILDAGFHPDDNRRRHNFTINLQVNIK